MLPADGTEAADLERVKGAHVDAAALLGGDIIDASIERLRALGGVGANPWLTRSLHPCFVTAAQYARAQSACSAVARTMAHLGLRCLQDATLRRLVGWPAEMDWLVEVDAESPRPRLVGRVDGVVDEAGRYRVLEHNATFVGGIAFSDLLSESFAGSPLADALASRHELRWPRTLPHAVEVMRRPDGSDGYMTLGIAAPEAVRLERATDVDSDLVLSLVELGRRGVPVRSASFDDLRVGAEGVHFGADRIDVLVLPPRPPLIMRALLQLAGDAQLHRQLLRSGRFSYFNGIAISLGMSSKLMLALTSDDRAEHWLEGLDRRTIETARGAIPWSRALVDGETEHEGKTVELVDLLRRQKDEFVLKPALGLGGEGIKLGWMCDSSSWDDALRDGLRGGNWIAQERVRPAINPWSFVEDGQRVVTDTAASFDLFTWRDEVAAGGISRTMVNGLMNVSQGAHLAPICVLD